MKKAVRQDVLARRLLLDPEEVRRLSEGVVRRVLDLPEVSGADSVMLYYPIKNEVSLISVFERFKNTGKDVCFPKVVGKQIFPVKINSLDELSSGYLSIPEPEFKTDRVLECPDVVFVPGLVFDRRCCRVGYGGGFYDKFLQDKESFKVGVCFDFQILERVPCGSFDVLMDVVVSEKRTLRRLIWS